MPDVPESGCGPRRVPALGVFPSADQGLAAQGWSRRFLADPSRAQEAVELYESLGFEVRAEPIRPEQFHESCGECPDEVCRVHVLIYTRRPASA